MIGLPQRQRQPDLLNLQHLLLPCCFMSSRISMIGMDGRTATERAASMRKKITGFVIN
jgi:hypothetical protein